MRISKKEWLELHGWATYYNPNYWVHPDSVLDPKSQDYTDYGMRIDDAIKYEKLGKPKHKPMMMPVISQMHMAIETKGLTRKPRKSN